MPKITCIKDYEDHAKEYLHLRTWTFFSMGSERDQTRKDNEDVYTRYKLIPRMLRENGQRDLSVTILGNRVALPIGIAPTAYQRMAHPDGELAAARAAAKVGTVYTLSTVSTTSLEDVSKCSSGAPQWMQVYILKNRSVTERMIQRAEANGFKALVLTVDTPAIGLHIKVWKTGFYLPPHLSFSNVEDAFDKRARDTTQSLDGMEENEMYDMITWRDVNWVRSISRLPIILKGIITVEDALLSVQYGASAVWLSNHGGRQLDGIDTPLDVLPDVKKALEGTNCEIYIDGGVRWGTDVLKALALGAQAVFIGRPMIWGLTHSGQKGVENVLNILKRELSLAMLLAGCKSISEIGPHLVKKRDSFKL